jgi:NtrC-family two-component system sensor histidine kinase KinB
MPAPHDPTPAADFQLLQAIAQEILASPDLADLLWTIARAVAARLGFYHVSIALVEEGRLVFRAAHGAGLDNKQFFTDMDADAMVLPLDCGLVGRAVRQRATVCVDDVAADPDYYPVAHLPDTRSEVSIPIVSRDRVLGVLDVQAATVAAFDDRAVHQLELLAPLIGVALENARAIARLEDQNRQLALSAAVSRIAVGAGDAEDLARRVCIRLREELGVQYAGVSVVDPAGTLLQLVGCALQPGFVESPPTTWSLDHRLVGRAAASECTLVLDAAVEPSTEGAFCEASRCEIAVPLKSAGKVVGILHLVCDEAGHFEPVDAQVLEALAGPVAHALANAVALRRISQLRNDLSSMIVHDVRNPLMVVLTALKVLERIPAVQEDSRCQRYLRNAGVAGDEVLRLVGSLLDIQKLESGELTLQRTEFNLGDVVSRVVANNRILAEVEEVTLDLDAATGLPAVRADLDLVLRTVENLVGNALKFTPSGGVVQVAVRLADAAELDRQLAGVARGVLVEVRDSGEGIPVGDQLRIFEKFGVVESRRRRVKVSTGLGLALCKLVVTAHGGAIWVDSEIGQGSRFAFILPAD